MKKKYRIIIDVTGDAPVVEAESWRFLDALIIDPKLVEVGALDVHVFTCTTQLNTLVLRPTVSTALRAIRSMSATFVSIDSSSSR